jgi:hypothetical protein
MSTYPVPDLLRRWSLGELTAEQARPEGTRQLLQHLLLLSQQMAELERRLRQGQTRSS